MQVGGRQPAGEIERVDRKDGGRLAIDDEIEVERKVAANLGDAVLHHLQRDDRVGARLELRGDLRGAAERPRPDAADARHFHDRLLERARDRQRHRSRGRAAGVRDDDDARELERRIDAARQRRGTRTRRRSTSSAVTSRIARDCRLAKRAGFICPGP